MLYVLIFIFLIPVFFALQENREVTVSIVGITLLYIFVLAFLVGINSNKIDFDGYLSYFFRSPVLWDSDFKSFVKTVHTEMGYNILQAFFKGIINSASLYFIIFCFISLSFRYKFYLSFVSKSDLGIVLFAFFCHEFLKKDCAQIRNGFASAIVLYSFIHLYRGNKIKFILTILLASCFQMTSLVAMPLIIVRNTYTKKYFCFLVSVYIIAIVFSVFFKIKSILIIFEALGILPKQILNYLYWTEYSQSMSLANPMILKQLFFVTFFLLCQKKQLKNQEKIFFFFQIYLVSTVYYLIFRDFEILAGRFGSLFYGVEPVLLLLAIDSSKKNKLIKKIMLIFMYCALFVINIISNPWMEFVPIWY